MKVAVTADNPEGTVSPIFGRAPYFIIYDTESGEKEVIPNPYAMAPNAAGIQAAQLIVDKGVRAVITAGFPGPNVTGILQMANIGIYQFVGTVKDALEYAKKLKSETPQPPYPSPYMSKEEEIRMLEEEKKYIEKRIEYIKERLRQLEGEK